MVVAQLCAKAGPHRITQKIFCESVFYHFFNVFYQSESFGSFGPHATVFAIMSCGEQIKKW